MFCVISQFGLWLIPDVDNQVTTSGVPLGLSSASSEHLLEAKFLSPSHLFKEGEG